MQHGDYAKINGLRVHVLTAGKGMPVVLIHGFMGMAYYWRFNFQELGKYFSIYAPDLPGFGYSNKLLL